MTTWSPVVPASSAWHVPNDDDPYSGLLVGTDTLLKTETGDVLAVVKDYVIWSEPATSSPVWS
jgi:hypothetical protein